MIPNPHLLCSRNRLKVNTGESSPERLGLRGITEAIPRTCEQQGKGRRKGWLIPVRYRRAKKKAPQGCPALGALLHSVTVKHWNGLPRGSACPIPSSFQYWHSQNSCISSNATKRPRTGHFYVIYPFHLRN